MRKNCDFITVSITNTFKEEDPESISYQIANAGTMFLKNIPEHGVGPGIVDFAKFLIVGNFYQEHLVSEQTYTLVKKEPVIMRSQIIECVIRGFEKARQIPFNTIVRKWVAHELEITLDKEHLLPEIK